MNSHDVMRLYTEVYDEMMDGAQGAKAMDMMELICKI